MKNFALFIFLLVLASACATTTNKPINPTTAKLTPVKVETCEVPGGATKLWMSKRGPHGFTTKNWVEAQRNACPDDGNAWIFSMHEQVWRATACFNDISRVIGKILSDARSMPLPAGIQAFSINDVAAKRVGWMIQADSVEDRSFTNNDDTVKTLLWLVRMFSIMDSGHYDEKDRLPALCSTHEAIDDFFMGGKFKLDPEEMPYVQPLVKRWAGKDVIFDRTDNFVAEMSNYFLYQCNMHRAGDDKDKRPKDTKSVKQGLKHYNAIVKK